MIFRMYSEYIQNVFITKFIWFSERHSSGFQNIFRNIFLVVTSEMSDPVIQSSSIAVAPFLSAIGSVLPSELDTLMVTQG